MNRIMKLVEKKTLDELKDEITKYNKNIEKEVIVVEEVKIDKLEGI